jgi:hypothetical protein
MLVSPRGLSYRPSLGGSVTVMRKSMMVSTTDA